MEDEEQGLKKLIRASNMEDVVLALAAMQPLVLRGVGNYTQGWATTAGSYSSGGYTWTCMFCHHYEYATTDLYGNPLNHAGEFDHADDCIWKRAKEMTGE